MKTRTHVAWAEGLGSAAVVDARGSRVQGRAFGVVRGGRRRAVEDLLAEHRQLRSAVEALQARLISPPPAGGGWMATLIERVDRLGVALADHFSAEEARGLLDAIGEAGASGPAAAHRLKGEHEHLLREVERLRADARRAGAGHASQRAWVYGARAFLAALADHEERENARIFDAVERVEAAQD